MLSSLQVVRNETVYLYGLITLAKFCKLRKEKTKKARRKKKPQQQQQQQPKRQPDGKETNTNSKYTNK